MQQKFLIAAAALLVASAPVALAGHSQLADGFMYSYPFQAIQDTTLGIDWAGVGGTEVCDGCANDSPTPDDCLDADHTPYYENPTFLKVALPSVSFQTPIERTQLVPGQSVPAPQALIDLCSMAREVLFGQESDHQYATQPQQIGFGEVVVGIDSVVTQAGFFDTALVAIPSSLTFKYCRADFDDTDSTGTETNAVLGFPNGKLIVDGPTACDDLTGDYLAHLVDNPDQQWDAGRFNRINNGNVYRQSVSDEGDGLKIACADFSVIDASANAAGFFQDYSFYFVDNGDANVVTDFWTDPIAHSDGGSPGQDCLEVGIFL